MDLSIYLAILVSFVGTWIAIGKWIRRAPSIGLLGLDMNKPKRPQVAEMGGICIVFGFVLGVLVYLGLQTFYFGSLRYSPILAALCTVLMACILGIIDDILGWKTGLRQWQKPIFMLFAAMPMMVINVGHTTMDLPLFGPVNLEIFYPLVIVPIGIVGASNLFNMLAGYNGLEAGMGVIIFSTLGYASLLLDMTGAAALSLIMTGALLIFLRFNWYPAKIFPGDTMTYSVGALAACIAIIGDIEKLAIILFIPYAVDFFLQLTGKFRMEAFAEVNEDGSLEMPYEGTYHLSHLAIKVLKRVKGKVYERDVVLFLCGIEIVAAGLGILAYL
jgi:UDP-N-acetylglucosamine--dolichyl-phosphate N-acetylglucosaminephosphotransferase